MTRSIRHKRRNRVVFIAVIFFVLWMTSRVQMRGQEITFTQFEQEIKDDNVTEVVINQNKAVPTEWSH